MSKKTRMVRVHVDLAELLEKMSQEMTEQSGRRITKTDISHMLAMQNSHAPLVIKKGKKIIIGRSLISL